MIKLQEYYKSDYIWVLVEIGNKKPMCLYYSIFNNISRNHDYAIVKKIFHIDYSMYDVFDYSTLENIIHRTV